MANNRNRGALTKADAVWLTAAIILLFFMTGRGLI